MNEPGLREAIATHGRSLYTRGLSPGTSGNISVRTNEGFLMTPTESPLGMLDPKRLAEIDPNGSHVGGDPPTKESLLHLAMYEERPDAQAIVHLHSTYAVAASCLDGVDAENVLPPLTPYYVMRVGRLPLVPYVAPGDRALADAVRAASRKGHAILLANHGPLVSGRSLSAAISAAEELEETAKLFFILGGRDVRVLNPDQVMELRVRFEL